MKRILFLILLSIFTKSTFAQDSLYYKTFNDYITFKLNHTYRGLSFLLSPRKDGLTQYSKAIWYRPNVRSIMGMEVAFKDISIGWSFRLAQNAIFNPGENESEYSDFQLHYIGKKMIYDLYYQNFQGYFIDNSEKVFISDFLKQNEVVQQQRDDIKLRNVLANVTYLFNSDEFSYNAAFTHKQKQLKSAGSFIITGSLGYVKIKGDSSHIPNYTTINFSRDAYINNIEFYLLSVVPGYAYTLLLGNKGFQVSGSVSGFTGLQINQAVNRDNLGFFIKGNARAYLGYHGQVWVCGISGLTDIQAFNTQHVQYRTNNLSATIFLVYKLKTKWMKGRNSFYSDKLIEKVNEQKEKIIPNTND